jgi:hypothetical protein
MQDRSSSSQFLLYIGLLAMALSVIAFGLMTAVKAATGLSEATPRDKTLLELQIESSRGIRSALATPVVTPPLPAITARPARVIAAVTAQRKPTPAVSREAWGAMAMGQSADLPTASQPRRDDNYPTLDRHAASF